MIPGNHFGTREDNDVAGLKNSQQTIMAQTAQLTEFRLEVQLGFTDLKESIQALVDMYGQHEFELAKLRRKPV